MREPDINSRSEYTPIASQPNRYVLSVALAVKTKRLNIENRIAENECEQ